MWPYTEAKSWKVLSSALTSVSSSSCSPTHVLGPQLLSLCAHTLKHIHAGTGTHKHTHN